jgi:hypothetical protein
MCSRRTCSCPMCDYVCTLPYGHPQAEHDTSHGSMSKTQWALDGGENAILEIDGHKFAANDAGAPMLCNSVCEAQGRHVHLDYCRATSGTGCAGNEIEHLTTKIGPDPDRPKDAISHSVFWKRSGASTYPLILCVLSPSLGFRGTDSPISMLHCLVGSRYRSILARAPGRVRQV